MIDTWHKYCQKQMKDQFHMLDEKLIFSNIKTGKARLCQQVPALSSGTWEYSGRLGQADVHAIFSRAERHKIEWSHRGSVVSGESKRIQKFLVSLRCGGNGKEHRCINVIQQLFEGYYTSFNAKDLGSSSNAFALEAFRSNPLVAIQHDGDLSRIEDNTRINSLVSHEMMTVNEKFQFSLFQPVQGISDHGHQQACEDHGRQVGHHPAVDRCDPHGRQGGPPAEYRTLTKQIPFELGGIAYHCQEVYLAGPGLLRRLYSYLHDGGLQ